MLEDHYRNALVRILRAKQVKPGLYTRVEIGHICIGPAGNGRIRSCGSGSSPNQRRAFRSRAPTSRYLREKRIHGLL
jgi:hypothetical protein